MQEAEENYITLAHVKSKVRKADNYAILLAYLHIILEQYERPEPQHLLLDQHALIHHLLKNT